MWCMRNVNVKVGGSSPPLGSCLFFFLRARTLSVNRVVSLTFCWDGSVDLENDGQFGFNNPAACTAKFGDTLVS